MLYAVFNTGQRGRVRRYPVRSSVLRSRDHGWRVLTMHSGTVSDVDRARLMSRVETCLAFVGWEEHDHGLGSGGHPS